MSMLPAVAQVLDVGEVLGVSKAIPIAIRGEAYDIHIDLKCPQDSFVGVDFGALRVVDDCSKQIGLRNTEKYDVKFSFTITSDEARELVTITPDAGVLPPGKEVSIVVSFLRPPLDHAHNTCLAYKRACCVVSPVQCSSPRQPSWTAADAHVHLPLLLNRFTGTKTTA